MIIEARNRPRALVIDDEPDIRDLLGITLGRMQIEVVTAGDHASALKALGGERFDLVLTDMRLPDGNGLDIVEWIQQHRPGVPVVKNGSKMRSACAGSTPLPRSATSTNGRPVAAMRPTRTSTVLADCGLAP